MRSTHSKSFLDLDSSARAFKLGKLRTPARRLPTMSAALHIPEQPHLRPQGSVRRRDGHLISVMIEGSAPLISRGLGLPITGSSLNFLPSRESRSNRHRITANKTVDQAFQNEEVQLQHPPPSRRRDSPWRLDGVSNNHAAGRNWVHRHPRPPPQLVQLVHGPREFFTMPSLLLSKLIPTDRHRPVHGNCRPPRHGRLARPARLARLFQAQGLLRRLPVAVLQRPKGQQGLQGRLLLPMGDPV